MERRSGGVGGGVEEWRSWRLSLGVKELEVEFRSGEVGGGVEEWRSCRWSLEVEELKCSSPGLIGELLGVEKAGSIFSWEMNIENAQVG